MRYIDAFNHFFPQRLWDKMLAAEGATRDIGKRMRGVPCIYDLDERFRVMDMFTDYTQILSLGMPPLEALGTPEQTTEYARLGNDGNSNKRRLHGKNLSTDGSKARPRKSSNGASEGKGSSQSRK